MAFMFHKDYCEDNAEEWQNLLLSGVRKEDDSFVTVLPLNQDTYVELFFSPAVVNDAKSILEGIEATATEISGKPFNEIGYYTETFEEQGNLFKEAGVDDSIAEEQKEMKERFVETSAHMLEDYADAEKEATERGRNWNLMSNEEQLELAFAQRDRKNRTAMISLEEATQEDIDRGISYKLDVGSFVMKDAKNNTVVMPGQQPSLYGSHWTMARNVLDRINPEKIGIDKDDKDAMRFWAENANRLLGNRDKEVLFVLKGEEGQTEEVNFSTLQQNVVKEMERTRLRPLQVDKIMERTM